MLTKGNIWAFVGRCLFETHLHVTSCFASLCFSYTDEMTKWKHTHTCRTVSQTCLKKKVDVGRALPGPCIFIFFRRWCGWSDMKLCGSRLLIVIYICGSIVKLRSPLGGRLAQTLSVQTFGSSHFWLRCSDSNHFGLKPFWFKPFWLQPFRFKQSWLKPKWLKPFLSK